MFLSWASQPPLFIRNASSRRAAGIALKPDSVTMSRVPVGGNHAQYDAEIAYIDACLERVFHRLDELSLAEKTLVIVTADHGEEMDEHQMWFDHHGL